MSAEPVYVVSYDQRWPELFEAERRRVVAVLEPWVTGVEHAGSTAVPGLDAKPVIDLLVGLRTMRDADRCVRPLVMLGYFYWKEGPEPYHRLFVRFVDYGRTARTHNLHLVETGGEYWIERLLFRDYLRDHPETARDYARLKHELAARYRHDREAYTAAKADFVRDVVRVASGKRRAGE